MRYFASSALLLILLSGCRDSFVLPTPIQERDMTDSVSDTGGIVFDLSDTTMTEEVDIIHFGSEAWDEDESDVEL